MTLGAFCNTVSFILNYGCGHIDGSRREYAVESGASRSISDPRLFRFGSLTPCGWHTVARMTSHSYEISLYGQFLKGDLRPILNRVALHSESAHQMHSREVIFDPPDAALQREANQEPALLRALKELLEPDAKW
jgi:hypothetical protein